MLSVFRDSWALFLGVLLLMIGNAAQGSLLGVRSEIEQFPVEIFGYVSAAYYAGFLGGSWLTPMMLRRVGHIRVFAALGSLISAAFIIYAAIVDPIAWMLMRLVVGFCFSGLYIVVESWLNDVSTNETRGQTLSAYMTIQYFGIVLGQQMLNLGDPGGYDLFIAISVLVSVAFAPILLSVSPAPVYQASKPMSLRELMSASPLGCVGAVLLGGVFSAIFGMSAVYGAKIGLNLAELSLFLTALYAGAMLFQPPIGWLSDRMDRRILIIASAAGGVAMAVLAMLAGDVVIGEIGKVRLFLLFPIALVFGGIANPIYALLLAHTNDFLEHEQMASASGGVVFLNGVGALGGPILVGYLMTGVGANGFWAFCAVLFSILVAFALYRATQRPTVPREDAAPYTPVATRMTPIIAEMYQEHMIEQQSDDAQSEEAADQAASGAAKETT